MKMPWPHCRDCRAELNDEEIYFYETRCEKCVRAYDARVEAWRCGGEDAELDTLFTAPMRQAS